MPIKTPPIESKSQPSQVSGERPAQGHAAHDFGMAQRLREFHPRFTRFADAEIFDAQLSLSDAQLAVAREYGFPSWARLKKHIEKPTLSDQLNLPHHERIEDTIFRRAVELLDAGDVSGLRAHLKQHPNLAHRHIVFEGGNYFRNPTLLEFIGENPVRRGTLPHNILDVAKLILDAGVEHSALNETLMLVATGSVPRECHMQLPLIVLLCDHGADPDSAIRPAALHGEIESVNALMGCGARIDLPAAAALGRNEDVRRLLPYASSEDRHLALSIASNRGHVDIVRLLLDTGEDPNRYNPIRRTFPHDTVASSCGRWA